MSFYITHVRREAEKLYNDMLKEKPGPNNTRQFSVLLFLIMH